MKTFRELQIEHLPECTYCSEPATTRDHVPPVSLVGKHNNTVPACVECNCALQGHWLMTLESRYEYMKAWRSRRAKHGKAA